MISKTIRHTFCKLSGISLLGVLLCGASLLAVADCSVQSLTGRYGFVVSGSLNVTPVAIVGQLATDGTGFISGIETASKNGAILNSAELLGNYAVNTDCSGTLTIQAQGQSPQHFNIALIAGGKQFSMVATDPGTTESGASQAEGPESCSSSDVHGVYALQASGMEGEKGPVALGGQVVFNGDGTLGGMVTVSVNGVITSAPVSGGYKVSPLCFGAASLAVGNRSFINLNLVVVNGGKGIDFIRVNSNTMESGTMQQ